MIQIISRSISPHFSREAGFDGLPGVPDAQLEVPVFARRTRSDPAVLRQGILFSSPRIPRVKLRPCSGFPLVVLSQDRYELKLQLTEVLHQHDAGFSITFVVVKN